MALNLNPKGWPGRWLRPVSSTVETYRTKRGEPCGDATLACGHVVLVSLRKTPVRRACWKCATTGRVAYWAAPPSPAGERPPKGGE